MSIQDAGQKIKAFLDSPKGHELLIIMIIMATALGSFMLGKITQRGSSPVVINSDPNLIIRTPEQAKMAKSSPTTAAVVNASQSTSTTDSSQKGDYVASSRGKKYYPVDCAAASSLKESNKIYFQTMEEAEGKGYTLSASCN